MDLLKNTLKVSAIGALTATLAFSVLDAKAEDVESTITATVSNAIDFVETTAMSFGEFVAISDASDTQTIVIAPGGGNTVGTTGDARIVQIVTGNPGVFDVSGAAPDVSLDLTLPTTATLSCTDCTGTPPDFEISAFTSTPTVATLETDATGAVTINVGATLTTAATAVAYEDGTYEGDFTISVNY